MARIIRGWNDIPDGYVQEEDFHLAPLWLRILARITFFEKYAYPFAVKKGLIKRWRIEPIDNGPEFFWRDGIKYINATYPGFSHGSPIEIKINKSKIYLPSFLIIAFSFLVSISVFIKTLVLSPFRTKWGSNKKTSYIKAKIASSKSS